MERIGVRELRQHASRFLTRVAHGERFEVTDRGRPVAHLIPVYVDTWDDMVASGRVLLADDDSDVLDERPVDYGIDASAALADARADER
jgi:prevent-host-death family protein